MGAGGVAALQEEATFTQSKKVHVFSWQSVGESVQFCDALLSIAAGQISQEGSQLLTLNYSPGPAYVLCHKYQLGYE